ncbi:MAG TPA: transglycosylase domain-containing protein [Chloroflexota bacterium]|nr:transglycosylase domain-containing protein [Chloroflexota bacterium]
MRAAPRSDRAGIVYLHKGRRRKPPMVMLLVAAIVLLPFVPAGAVAASAIYAGYSYYTATVRAANLPHLQPYAFQDARIYDRYGTLLYEVGDPLHGERRPVPLAAVPRALQQATIAIEDKTFYANPGFDVRGVVRAAHTNLMVGHVVEGGSSITQQLVKMMLLSGEPTFARKVHELALAYALTRRYSKTAILRMYLNTVYYGARAYGVEAAAETYFHRHVSQLDLAQSALLAGLPQSPSLYSPLVHPALALGRQQVALQRMVAQGYITAAQARAAMAEARHFTYTAPPTRSSPAPQFVQYLLERLEQSYGPALYTRGLRIYTTLDLRLQRYVQAQVAAQIRLLAAPHNMHDGAAVVLGRSGGILAMVGAANPADTTPQGAGQVNMAVWPISPGSSFKLFTYLAAFEHGYAPASVIDDTPVVYPDPWGNTYVPSNYDQQFHGAITLRVALANSYNVPAVKLTNQLGVGTVLEMTHRLGITTLNDPPQHYGLPLTLGDGRIPLLELANAYDTMARGGLWRSTTPILRVTDADGHPVAPPALPPARRVVSPQIAYLMTSILSDNFARIREFGYNSVLQLQTTPAAAKTGTSQDWKDNVTVGYTPQYTTAVWVGNANGEPMHTIIGIDGAGPIWHAVMARLTLDRPARPFLRPPGITLATVSGYSGLLAVPGSGWTITDVFAPKDLPHTYDNPYVDNTAVPLWDSYSMNVHDGNWDYPGTQRYALPVGGPLNAPPS